jgi:hypothetical protein
MAGSSSSAASWASPARSGCRCDFDDQTLAAELTVITATMLPPSLSWP